LIAIYISDGVYPMQLINTAYLGNSDNGPTNHKTNESND